MSVYKAVYRVRVGVLSRKGILLNPVDFVVSADTNDLNVVRKYYDEKYKGFDVIVENVVQVEVCIPTLSVPAEIAPTKTRYFQQNGMYVTIDEALCADYRAKGKAYESVKDSVKKASIAKILALNTHLASIYKFELLGVDGNAVRADISAELKGEFVKDDTICAISESEEEK